MIQKKFSLFKKNEHAVQNWFCESFENQTIWIVEKTIESELEAGPVSLRKEGEFPLVRTDNLVHYHVKSLIETI